MGQRFFVDSPVDSDRVTITGSEAHHVINVMRAAVGDQVTLFDGSGSEFQAQIQSLKKNAVDLLIVDQRSSNRELPSPLTVAVALPKGDRQKWLVEKLVELGTSTLIPLVTERSVAQPVTQALSRLQRTVIEASKQCGRNQLMKIEPPQTVTECIALATDSSRRIFAHVQADPVESSIDHHFSNLPELGVVLAVGPEGGWTEEEVEQFREAQWQPASMGSRVLRIETAAIALVARCVLQDGWL